MNNNSKAFAYKNCKNGPTKCKNGIKTAKMRKKSVFFDVIVFVCQVAISSTMVAAFGQLFFLSFSAPFRLLCYLGLFVVVYCLLNFATKGMHVLNIVLSLVMMVFISVVFLLSIKSATR